MLLEKQKELKGTGDSLGKTFTGENPTMYNEDIIIIQKSSIFLVRNMQKFTLLSCVSDKIL